MRGTPGRLTAYSATKAALVNLAEGMRGDILNEPQMRVTLVYLGTVETELNLTGIRSAFMVSLEKVGKQLLTAIDHERPTTIVPSWPWAPLALVSRLLPLSVVAKLAKST
jgi:short-subunit dehydrogenase